MTTRAPRADGARRRRAARWLGIALGAGATLALGGAAFAPLPRASTREREFVIPEGTWRRRMAGEAVEILPSRIRLTLGLQDVLLLRNQDTVPQTFGPALLMPGQSFRLPFALASRYDFACSAHASGQMSILVDPFPATPLARLRWRLRRAVDAFVLPAPSTPHEVPNA